MASSDEKVLSVVHTLQVACQQLDAEMRIINEDLATTAEQLKRYGDIFLAPVKYLTQLRENKRLRYKEIVGQLEALKTQMECSASLLAALNTSQPVTLVQNSPARAGR